MDDLHATVAHSIALDRFCMPPKYSFCDALHRTIEGHQKREPIRNKDFKPWNERDLDLELDLGLVLLWLLE